MSQIYYALPDHSKLKNGIYTIEKTLANGGMGITYTGYRHTDAKFKDSEYVVIKELFIKPNATNYHCTRNKDEKTVEPTPSFIDDFKAFKKRFEEEAEILHQLKKEAHIVNVIDSFEENNTWYFVMEFIEAESLDQYIDRCGALSISDTYCFLNPISQVLIKLHSKGMLHRDIKPANILIDKNKKAYLIDFGIAKSYKSFEDEVIMTGIGTPGFSPAEQISGKTSDIGPTLDVYALAATYYNCLTGEKPQSFAEKQCYERKTILTYKPELPKQLSVVIDKAMQDKVDDRTQNIEEFLNNLSLINEGVLDIETEVAPKSSESFEADDIALEQGNKKKQLMGIYVLIGLILVLGLVWLQFEEDDVGKIDPIYVQDNNAWINALKEDTLPIYLRYQSLFPQGIYYVDAQQKIDSLNNILSDLRANEKNNRLLEDKQAWQHAKQLNSLDLKIVDKKPKVTKNTIQTTKVNYTSKISQLEESAVRYFLSKEYVKGIDALNKAQKIKFSTERESNITKYERMGAIEAGKIHSEMVNHLKSGEDECSYIIKRLCKEYLKLKNDKKVANKLKKCK